MPKTPNPTKTLSVILVMVGEISCLLPSSGKLLGMVRCCDVGFPQIMGAIKDYRGCIGTCRLQGFPKSGGIFLGGPYHKHHSILGSILVCLFWGGNYHVAT